MNDLARKGNKSIILGREIKTKEDNYMLPKNAVGLYAGLHEIPVEKYIFTDVQNVLDFDALTDIAEQFVIDHCGVHRVWSICPSQTDYFEIERRKGHALDVVVTSLNPCTTALMGVCVYYGVPLTLCHYDRESGDYVPQKFNF